MKGDGMSMAWMSFNLPNFFRGTPSPKPPFAPQKGNGKQKKNPKQPFKPTLGVSPPTSAPKKKSSIAN